MNSLKTEEGVMRWAKTLPIEKSRRNLKLQWGHYQSWYIVEEMVANPEKPVSEEDRGELIQLAEQTVMLTGQTFNLITHN